MWLWQVWIAFDWRFSAKFAAIAVGMCVFNWIKLTQHTACIIHAHVHAGIEHEICWGFEFPSARVLFHQQKCCHPFVQKKYKGKSIPVPQSPFWSISN